MISLCNLRVLRVSVVERSFKPQRHGGHRGCTEIVIQVGQFD